MDKMQKIGKTSRDIFAPTSIVSNGETSAAPAGVESKTPMAIPSVAPEIAVASHSDAQSESESASVGRGRPQLHQEPVSKITTVLLNRHVVYLDGISNEIRQQSGAVVKRSEILRALVEALEAAQPDLNQVRSQADLTEILRLRLQ